MNNELTIGRVLPPGVPGTWLVGLAWALGDLNIANRRAVQAGEEDNGAELLYFARLAWAHFHEAIVLLRDRGFDPELKAFFDSLPPGVRSQAGKAESAYNRFPTQIKAMRDGFLHYPSRKSNWRSDWDALENLVRDRSGLEFAYGGPPDGRFGWADELGAAHFEYWVGSPFEANFRSVTDAVTEGLVALTEFAMQALTVAVERATPPTGSSPDARSK